MQSSNSIALIALVLVVGAALYFIFPRQDEAPDAIQLESNYYLKNYHLKIFDESGKLRHRLSGALLRQLSTNNQYNLERPHFELHTGASDWQLSSELGWMDADMAHARLIGSVKIEDQATPHMTIASSLLKLDLTNQIASTDDAVNVKQGEHYLNGKRMTADLKSRVLEISPEVTGHYAP